MNNAALLYTIIQYVLDRNITIDEIGAIKTIGKDFDYLEEEEEVINQNFSMLTPWSDLDRYHKDLSNYKATEKPSIFGYEPELIELHKADYQFPIKLEVSEEQNSGRTIYAGFNKDLTQHKVDEGYYNDNSSHMKEMVEERTKLLQDTIVALEKEKEKISISLEKEKELSKLKNRFLSMASHEFRTPLSTIQLSVSLIEKYATPFENDSLNKHIAKIKNSVTSLTAILNDFLYFEKLEIGKMQAVFTSFDLVKFGDEIKEEMQFLAKPNQNIICKHVGIQTIVNLDANLLKNCAINLIGNAIKYSGNNCCIDFTTEINDSYCLISVHDNGIGIPLEEQKHLFQPFFRAHNTSNVSGTGLGLNIVERYVSLMKEIGRASCGKSV